MNLRNALILVALLLGLAALWQVVSAPVGPVVADEPDISSGDGAAELVEAKNDDSVVQAEEARAERSEVELAEAPHDASAGKVVPHYSGEDGIELTVLNSSSKEPVAGATVFITSLEDQDWAQLSNSKLSSFDQVRRYGKRYLSDSEGKLRIAPDMQRVRILAEFEDLICLRHGRTLEGEDSIILLEPNLRFWVEVVDKKGDPMADYPVSTYFGGAANKTQSNTVYTNADGRVLMEDVGKMLAQSGVFGGLYLGIGVIGLEEAEEGTEMVKLSKELVEQEVVRLVGRSYGTVVATLLDANGEAIEGEGWGMLSAKSYSRGESEIRSRVNRTPDKGVIRFEGVALNQEFTLRYQQGGLGMSDEIDFAGPVKVGEVVRVELRQKTRAVVVGTVVLEDGKPLVNQSITIELTRHKPDRYSRGNVRVTTGDEGQFEFSVPDQGRPNSGRDKDIVLEANPVKSLIFDHRNDEGELWRNEVAVGLPETPAETDIGVVQLAKRVPVLSGRVVDQLGNPVKQVYLSLNKYWFDEQGKKRNSWRFDLSANTDKDGRFTLYGEIEAESNYRVRLHHQDYEESYQEVSLPAVDQEFVIHKAPAIYAELLVDEGIQASDFSHDVKYEEDNRSHVLVSPRLESGQGKVKMKILGKAGTPFTFNISTFTGELLYQSSEVILAVGEELRPPELNPLDLRGRLKQFTIRSQDAAGKALAAQVEIIEGRSRRSTSGWGSGEARFVTLAPIPKLRVSADGFHTEELTDIHEDHVVTLRKMMTATLQLPQEYLKYREGVVRISRAWGPVGSEMSSSLDMTEQDENGRVQISFPEAGTYTVRLAYSPRFGSARLQRRSQSHSRQEVEIQSQGQLITVTVDEDDLNGAVEKMIERSNEEGQ